MGERRESGAREYLIAVVGVLAATVIGLGVRGRLAVIDIAMLFLLAVVAVATRTRLGPALLATALAILAFDVGFVPPYNRITVDDSAYLLTFTVMLVVAIVMSQLTTRIRTEAQAAHEAERHASALFELSRALSGVTERERAFEAGLRVIGVAGNGSARLLPRRPGAAERDWLGDASVGDLELRVAAEWSWRHEQPAGLGTEHCADAPAFVMPLVAPAGPLGLIVFSPLEPERWPERGERRTVEALVRQLGDALARVESAEGRRRAEAVADAERLRTALLSSLSHDLRTPLGIIEGAASALLEREAPLDAEARRELAATVLEESRRMNRLIGNLLNMVRVESGTLAVHASPQPLEESLGVALLRMEERLAERQVDVALPPDLPLVSIDELLMEQVFLNLLENAARHTPAGTPIAIRAWPEGGEVLIEVADQGPGIPSGQEERIFEKFSRGGAGEPTGGLGLGLAICRGIVRAHGGRIWAEPGSPGARIRIALPGASVGSLPPSEPADIELG
ncbi:MAG: DUF4118 domain-containing protein [Gemmatimonadales bacterium]